MDDTELLAAARKYEKLLTSLYTGEAMRMVDVIVDRALLDKDNPALIASAQIALTFGKFLFGWSMDEMIRRLKELY